MAEAATGAVRVEKVRGRSALTRCFARYPLKLIAPSKVGPASCDAVWLYALTYGGGIVSVSPRPSPLSILSTLPAAPSRALAVRMWLLHSLKIPRCRTCLQGDTISCTVIVGDGCTAAITTQASTKVCLLLLLLRLIPFYCLGTSGSRHVNRSTSGCYACSLLCCSFRPRLLNEAGL